MQMRIPMKQMPIPHKPLILSKQHNTNSNSRTNECADDTIFRSLFG
jgi:hypothetical protein